LAFVHWGRSLIGLATVEVPLQKADIPWLAAVIFFGGMSGPLFLMFGLSLTSAATGSLLLNLEGLATMAIAWLVFREDVDRRLLLGAFAILCGAAILSWNGLRLDTGGFFIALACLCWGVDNNLTRKISSADPVQIAMLKRLVAGCMNFALALALWLGASLPGPALLAAGTIVGFLGVGFSLVMFMLGLRHLGTASTGAYFSLAPFIGAILAAVLFKEAITLPFVAAGVLMAVGLWLHLAERHDHAHTHDLLDHYPAHSHDAHHQHDHEGPVTEPHSHWHRHKPTRHKHPHYTDLHHRHGHNQNSRPRPASLC
jgi:drug/metabolite transporter (DMT)-like permease